MNNQLIEKIITSNNFPCPEFTFENPLLDKNVANALSKSFVKILNLSQQNLKVNNNLRLSILENIRKMCQIEPENHIRIGENLTTFLTEAYEPKLKGANDEFTDANSTSKVLDEFLVRNMKDMNISSNYNISLNPEVLQALLNLNENGIYRNTLCKDIIHWNSVNNKYVHILKELWNCESLIADDISVLMKSELEKILLETCHSILNDSVLDIEEQFTSNTDLKNIVIRSSNSATCFQISSSILNFLLIMTNFAPRIQTFVQTFVDHVKHSCTHLTFSVLYPIHISHIVVLLDIDMENLGDSLIQVSYIKETMQYLRALHSDSENDFIMLLSHFPLWFDIYFNEYNSSQISS